MQDTYFFIDYSQRIRSSNSHPKDNEFFIKDGKYIFGPKNSAKYWIEGDQILSDQGDTDFRIMPDKKIFGPSQQLPWFD